MATPDEIDAGQAIYSPRVLHLYDWVFLGLSNHLLRRCPTAELRRLYDRNVTARHLDIGVGTGYFLDHARWPVPDPVITLLDLNPNCLEFAARRLSRYAPRTIRANVLDPLPALEPASSVALCYLLHCLPGAIATKAIAFDHLRPLLSPGGRLFGATIGQDKMPCSRPAQALMNLYNKKGIVSNAKDSVEDLDRALRKRFSDVTVQLRGTVALFEARAG